MKSSTLVRKMKLSDGDFDSIKKAVCEAELRTNGEIALAATMESSDYSFHELLASVILGAVVFAVMLPLNGPIGTLLDRLFWHTYSWYLPAFYGFAVFAVIALFFLFANIPAVDRLLIPRSARHKAVYNRALRHFVESGVYGTKDRTGILIFISYMEHEVRIITDSGINAKIAQGEWDDIAHTVALGVRGGTTADALVAAVKKCATLLAANFPPESENPNELADGLVILEAGQ
jgi:putative membrane protein